MAKTRKELYGRKYPSARASKNSVLKAQCEKEDIDIREWRRSVNSHRNRHFDGGSRPLERKRSKKELNERYSGGPSSERIGMMLDGLVPEDRSASSDLLEKLHGEYTPRRFR